MADTLFAEVKNKRLAARTSGIRPRKIDSPFGLECVRVRPDFGLGQERQPREVLELTDLPRIEPDATEHVTVVGNMVACVGQQRP